MSSDTSGAQRLLRPRHPTDAGQKHKHASTRWSAILLPFLEDVALCLCHLGGRSAAARLESTLISWQDEPGAEASRGSH